MTQARSTDLLHRQAFRVHSFDVDGRGRLLPQALLGFLQEAAGRNAHARGAGMSHLRERGLAWMLLRLVVSVAAWPTEQEEVTVTTWPTHFGRASAERDFTIDDAAGRRRATASSRWAVVDLAARRAVRLPDFVRALSVGDGGSALPFSPAAASDPRAPRLGEWAVEVGRSDLDVVGHANNTRYLEWALDALPLGFEDGREITGLDLTFRREARYGDRLTSRALLLEEDVVAHELRPLGGEQLCALVVSRWGPMSTGGRA